MFAVAFDDLGRLRWFPSFAEFSKRISANPKIAVIGVRISWLMFARNSLLDRLADLAAIHCFLRLSIRSFQ